MSRDLPWEPHAGRDSSYPGVGPELYSRRGRSIKPFKAAAAAAEAVDLTEVERLRSVLTSSFQRVTDLFRDIDADSDGAISRAEFRRVMLDELGQAQIASATAVDALFDTLDVDGNTKLTYRELHRALRGGADVRLENLSLDGSRLAVGYDAPRASRYVRAGTRPNWSMRKVDGASGLVVHASASTPNLRRSLSRSSRSLGASANTFSRSLTSVGTASQSRLTSVGTPAHAGSPPRSSAELFSDLQQQPTESYLNRTESMRGVPPVNDQRVWVPPSLVPKHQNDGVWWTHTNHMSTVDMVAHAGAEFGKQLYEGGGVGAVRAAAMLESLSERDSLLEPWNWSSRPPRSGVGSVKFLGAGPTGASEARVAPQRLAYKEQRWVEYGGGRGRVDGGLPNPPPSLYRKPGESPARKSPTALPPFERSEMDARSAAAAMARAEILAASRASAQPADPLGEAATFFGGGGMFGPSTRVIPGVGLVYKPE